MKENLRCKGALLHCAVMCSLLWVATACSEDLGLKQSGQEALAEWPVKNVDPDNTWMTSVTVQLDINAGAAAEVTAQTIQNEKVTILGQQQVEGSGVMFVDVPQGCGNSFGLVYDDGTSERQYRRIDLTGEARQVVDVDFSAPQAAQAMRRGPQRVATNQALFGKSETADCGYLNFGPWAWDDIAASLKEGARSDMNYIAMIDYEIMARGELAPGGEYKAEETVYLSFLYGFTGQYNPRVLGYYVHSGDYRDIEFHDLSEVLAYDYLNGKAKVQYQLDHNTQVWYDANFDYKDAEGLPKGAVKTGCAIRQGDDVYNTLKVKEAYGERLTAVRGLTFEMDIPQGKHFGFYLRTNDAINENQKTLLKKLGVPEANLPAYRANYSAAAMNTGGNKFRSAMAIYDNFTFMGLDDNVDGGDFDCNDVTFALSNIKGEKLVPKFTDETLKSLLNQGTLEKHPEYGEAEENGGGGADSSITLQSWTLAFENGGIDIDFDFNDVVLEVIPNTSTHTATVYLLAAGAQRRTEVYYGDRLLGEVHEKFSREIGSIINTRWDEAELSPVLLADDLTWPEGYTMKDNRHLFYLKVYNDNGDLDRIVRSDELLGENKDIPQVLCIAGEWSWPKETQRVYEVYPMLGEWAKAFNSSEAWNWYSQPQPGRITRPKKK